MMDVTKIYYNSHTLDVVDNINKITKAFPHVRTYQKAIADKYNIYTTTGSVIKGREAVNIIKNTVSTLDCASDYAINISSDIYRNSKIILLWATVRPEEFKVAHRHWMNTAKIRGNVITRVAVDTQEQAEQLPEFDVMITNNKRPGVCYPCYCLSSTTTANDNDIIIFASDDFFPPDNWDIFLYNQLCNESEKLLMVNDGLQPSNSKVVTIPILRYDALKKLNHIIYNPTYTHMWSDDELYTVANKLGLIKDIRRNNPTIFEHRHYANGKRVQDIHDLALVDKYESDRSLHTSRHALTVTDLLKIPKSISDEVKSITYKNANKPSVNIFTNYYKTPSNIRDSEILASLQKNIENHNITKIYIIRTKSDEHGLKSDKIIDIISEDRPTYKSLFNQCNKVTGVNDVNIIINSDCFMNEFFIEIIENIKHNECYALNRLEVNNINNLNDTYRMVGTNDSQDAWVFRGPISIKGGEFFLGKPGCDNKICYDAHVSNYDLINPLNSNIYVYHYHKDAYRSYNEVTDRLSRPYALVTESVVNKKSEIIILN
jgi:hypothetical protein